MVTLRKRHVLGIITLAAVTIAASARLTAAPPPGKSNPNGGAHGQSIAQWLTDYWRWYYTGGASATTPAPSGKKNVVFMPLPQGTVTGGSFTSADPGILVGQIEVTVPTGTAFVLPFFAWTSERYEGYPAVPDDIPITNDVIRNVIFFPGEGPGTDPEITLDGKPLLRDFWSHYVGPIAFTPPIVYPETGGNGAVSALYFQGAGVLVHPLPPGQHILHLYEQFNVTENEFQRPGYDLGVIYDNTWIINVEPRGQMK